MTKRNYLLFASFMVLLAVVAWRFAKHTESKQDDMLSVVAEPFQVQDGWGYKVVVEGKTYIYQDAIPGLPGNRPFTSKDDALRVGNMVVTKLTHHKIPSISEADLKSLQINY
ncbi:MAG: DUF4907 domain-containing protein [Chitinophaga sp.]|uniref:DUF4907 domain-containing protein n=1 Tax=Chitinophaga sp. TaxID=1869181 RepID=UPI0025BF0401|nr:DUF4907 domain-containing protein [Chitinophaga sp.]MBV8252875.1 DUF4907 domain-containing protein [Chitinophaga sp.]